MIYDVRQIKIRMDSAISLVLKRLRDTDTGKRLDPDEIFDVTVDMWPTLGLSADDVLYIAQDTIAYEIECRHAELQDELRETKPVSPKAQ